MSVCIECACGRAYTSADWKRLVLRGWSADDGEHALELRNCAACDSTLSILATRDELERIVDGVGAQVSYRQLAAGGWKAVVTGIELPPHFGHGETAAEALAEVLTFALRIGALK